MITLNSTSWIRQWKITLHSPSIKHRNLILKRTWHIFFNVRNDTRCSKIEITRNEANVSRINDRDEHDKTHFYLLFIMTVMKVVTAKITVITFICFRNCTPLLFILCQNLCFISRSNRMLYKTQRNGIKIDSRRN